MVTHRLGRKEEHKQGCGALGGAPVGGKIERGPTCHWLAQKIGTGAQPTPPTSERIKC